MPADLAAQDEISFVVGKRIRWYVALELRLIEALEKHHGEECPARLAKLLDKMNRSRFLWARESAAGGRAGRDAAPHGRSAAVGFAHRRSRRRRSARRYPRRANRRRRSRSSCPIFSTRRSTCRPSPPFPPLLRRPTRPRRLRRRLLAPGCSPLPPASPFLPRATGGQRLRRIPTVERDRSDRPEPPRDACAPRALRPQRSIRIAVAASRRPRQRLLQTARARRRRARRARLRGRSRRRARCSSSCARTRSRPGSGRETASMTRALAALRLNLKQPSLFAGLKEARRLLSRTALATAGACRAHRLFHCPADHRRRARPAGEGQGAPGRALLRRAATGSRGRAHAGRPRRSAARDRQGRDRLRALHHADETAQGMTPSACSAPAALTLPAVAARFLERPERR